LLLSGKNSETSSFWSWGCSP